MRLRPVLTAIVAASYSFLGALAQSSGGGQYVDPETGIVFSQYSADTTGPAAPKGGFQLGVAFPTNLDQNEYIGHIVGARPEGKGWSSISHAAGMTKSLLLIVWANGRDIQTSFRYCTNYTQPYLYVGPLSFTQLAHSVNQTHFSLTYRCQGCFSWKYGGVAGGQSLNGETVLFGWAQGTHNPANPADSNSPIDFHDNGFGVVATNPKLAAHPQYDQWAGKNKPSVTAIPKTSTAANSLSGNNTAWPIFTRKNSSTTRTTVTFGGLSTLGVTVAATTPLLPQSTVGNAPAIPQIPQQQNPNPPQGAAPRPTSQTPNSPVVLPTIQTPSAPGLLTTITRSQPPLGTPKPPRAQKGNGTDDDGWADVRTIDVRLFNTAPILPRDILAGMPASGSPVFVSLAPRQTDAKTPPPPASASESPTPVPKPEDDLGAFPQMSGVPKKPPGGAAGVLILPSPALSQRQVQPSGSVVPPIVES